MSGFARYKLTVYKKQSDALFVLKSHSNKTIVMDKHQIGLNAGKIWHLLANNNKWNYCELKEASQLSDRDLCAAIGWLARENKIDFEQGSGECFFLNVNIFIG